MPIIRTFNQYRVRRLCKLADTLKESGRTEEAIEKYRDAIRIAPDDATMLYNLALIHKYRNEWHEASDLNRRAFELDPGNEATRWNLAIAATALHDWKTAREMWSHCGIKIAEGEGPILDNFGTTPVRINPDGEVGAEVVWTRRIDPVRARIESIPLPESGYRFGDVVLHDGAPTGYRMSGDVEKPVFNVLELFAASHYGTWRIEIKAACEDAMMSLEPACKDLEIEVEDWTAMRYLCKQCSEGHPHEQHDHEGEPEWQDNRVLGAAAASSGAIDRLLARALPPGVEILSAECVLEPRAS